MIDQNVRTPATIAGQLSKDWVHRWDPMFNQATAQSRSPNSPCGMPANHHYENQVRDRKSRTERNTARMMKAITRTKHETLARQDAEGARH
jgi:hypothetical protein